MELISRLVEKFGYNEPIFTEELLSVWSEYSRPRVFQLLKEFTKQKALVKFDRGVYFIPTENILGRFSLDPQKVIEKKYIRCNGEVFGYYSGLVMENAFGLTTQVPVTFEIVTMKETTRMRRVEVGKAKVLLRRAKTQITKENAPVLQLLEILKNINEPLDTFQRNNIKGFMKRERIKTNDLYACSKLFPKRAIENLKFIGVENAVTL